MKNNLPDKLRRVTRVVKLVTLCCGLVSFSVLAFAWYTYGWKLAFILFVFQRCENVRKYFSDEYIKIFN